MNRIYKLITQLHNILEWDSLHNQQLDYTN